MQKRFLILMTLLLTLSLTAMAQITTSSMAGKVTVGGSDETAIGATVVAVHEPSGTRYTAVTNASGLFNIRGMRTGGPYAVTVTYIGFQPKTVREVTLQLAETYNLDVDLAENSTELTEVVISGRASKFAAEKTGATTNITSAQIVNLPTVNRTITDVTRLSPYGGNGMSFAGGNGKMTNFTVDGANFNNNFGLSDNLPGGGNPISIDAIEEMQVVISPFDVRQTNFIGGGVNAITKSGTNIFKGSAYVYHKNENMQGDAIEREPIASMREKDQTTTYGFTLGGPIIKNKLFFFVNGEMVQSPSVINRWRGSDSGAYDEKNYISRTSLQDLEAVSTWMRNTYGYETGSWTDYSRDKENYKILARLDWNITDRHHLSARYNYTKNRNYTPPSSTSNDGVAVPFGRTSLYSMAFANSMYGTDNLVNTFSLDLNSRLSDNLSNELMVTYSKLDDTRVSDSSEFPFMDIFDGAGSNYMTLGYELFTFHNAVYNNVWTAKDDVTYYLGNHTITGGVNYEYQRAENHYQRNGTGYFSYASIADLMSFATPTSVNLTYGYNGEDDPASQVTYNKLGIYLQDDWKVTDRFKLTYGLRVDGLFFDNNDLKFNKTIYDLEYPNGRINTGEWPSNSYTFSPRLGFTWDVFGNKRLKVRGGTGLFSGRIPLVFFTNLPQGSGMFQNNLKINKAADLALFGGQPLNNFVGTNGQTYDLTNRTSLRQFIVDNGLGVESISETEGSKSIDTGIQSDFKLPQVWKSSLAVDYQIPVSFPFTVTGEFIFNKTINGVYISDWSVRDLGGYARPNGADNRALYQNYKYIGADGKPLPTAYVLSNTSKGYGWTGTIELNAKPAEWVDLYAAYTHTVQKEITGMPGSNAKSAFIYIPSVEGPNNLKVHNSNFVTPDRFIVSANLHDKCNNHYSLIYESSRGNWAYSYILANDMNGDGNAYDLVYVPTDEQVANREFRFVSDDDRDRFMAFVHNNDYLEDRQGKYAEAYSAYNPWVHRIDFSYKHDFKVCLGNTTNTLQLSLDVKNVLNFFNSSWGVAKYMNPAITGTNYDAKILRYEGVDADGYATFSTPDGISSKTDLWKPYHSTGQCWYASVGARYIFEGTRKGGKGCGCDDEVAPIVTSNAEVDRLNREINNLRSQLAAANSRKPEKEVVKETVVQEKVVNVASTIPYLVNFSIGSADVANREKVNLEAIAAMIKAAPEKKFYVRGYADNQTGNEKLNDELSKKRSENVRDILVKQYGVSASQLVTEAKGAVDAMYYNDPQLSRSVVITEVK